MLSDLLNERRDRLSNIAFLMNRLPSCDVWKDINKAQDDNFETDLELIQKLA